MVLARGPGCPGGDTEDRIELQVRLNAVGQLDRAAWMAEPGGWTAARSRPGQGEQRGEIVLVDGSDGFWAARRSRSEDEPLWVLDSDVLRPGELAGVRAPDGTDLVFRVVAVE